jgi:pectate lyase
MAKGPRTVVFAVSGNIRLKSQIVVAEPYCTIAGQSAPGDGITLVGETMVIAGSHVVVRHIRVRTGSIVRVDDSIASRWGPRLVNFFRAMSAALARLRR